MRALLAPFRRAWEAVVAQGAAPLAGWVALAALVAHAGILPGGGGAVWGHEAINYDDPQVLHFAEERSVPEIVKSPTYFAYKPVYFLSLKADIALFGDHVSGGAHFENLLLHALAAFLLVVVLAEVLGSLFIAGAAGLLFAVHPAHVESVAWIAERKGVLSLVLVLAAHVAYRRGRDGGTRMLAPAVWLLLAGLTKGTVWTYAGILAIDEAVHSARRPGAFLRLLPCLVVGILGIAADAWIGAAMGPGSVDHGVSTLSLAAAMAAVHASYLLHTILPVGLSLDYAVDPAGSWTNPASLVGLVLAVGAVVLLVRGIRRREPLLAFAAGFWVLGLLPVNNVWPRTTTLMADRYLYVPAVGVYLLAAWAFFRAGWMRTALLGAAAVLLALLTASRTAAFKDSESVWADAVDKVPESALAWTQRAIAANGRHEWAYGEDHARRALKERGRPEVLVKARLARCDALLQLGRFDDLLDEANEASKAAAALQEIGFVREDPSEVRAEAEVRRGHALKGLGNEAGALDAYGRAVEWAPHSFEAQYNFGTTLLASGEAKRALEPLSRALDLRPDQVDAWLQLAAGFAADGGVAEAMHVLDRAKARHGALPEILLTRADLLLAQGSAEEAIRELQTILRASPEHPRAAARLSDLWIADGRRRLDSGRRAHDVKMLREALEKFDGALRVHPGRHEAEVGAGDALLELGAFRQARDRYKKARALASGSAWIDGLIARAAVLDAAWTARAAGEGAEAREAARLMAEAVRLPVARIDLGFVPLESELLPLRVMADRLDAKKEPEATFAAGVLVAAALLAAGDEEAAQSRVKAVMNGLPGDGSLREVFDAALLLKALIRDRRGDVEEARRDYESLAARRPEDPGPALRLKQLSLRIALARLETAKGYSEDPERIARAQKDVDAVCDEVSAFADAHPGDAGAGLLAAESDMRRSRWVEALKRLNALTERFPDNPSVFRGQSAIYVNQYLVSRDPSLAEEALRALNRAMTIDPRDSRAALDAAGVRRIVGDIPGAIRLAIRARALESVPGGTAARTLAALEISQGRQALDQGNLVEARKAIEAARQADPGSAASWILEGELFLEREKDLNKALEAGKKAKELEPLSREVDAFLSRCRYQRGLKASLAWAMLKEPERPEADAAAWAALDAEARRVAVAAFEKRLDAVRQQRQYLARQAQEEFEASLRLDPTAEHAAAAQGHLEGFRQNDPDARRERALKAQQAFVDGKGFLDDGKTVKALEAFREAVRQDPDHGRAHFFVVKCAHDLLAALTPTSKGVAPSKEELVFMHRYVNFAFESLQALDVLDTREEFPLRHFYRGLVNETIYRRDGGDEARLSAVRAYQRFLASPLVAEGKDPENATKARKRLDALLGAK